MARTPLLRAAGVMLLAAVASACGGAVGSEPERADDAGAPADEGAIDLQPDAGPCIHNATCSGSGTTCNNECGQPCLCTDVFGTGNPLWSCIRPVTGLRCDRTRDSSCSYRSVEGRQEPCTCESPVGEAFWNCGEKTLCLTDQPPDGETCAPLPLGLRCGYCECVPIQGDANTDRVFLCDG
jgi:hypothetical protein